MSDEQNHDEHVEHVEAPVEHEEPKDERSEFDKLKDDVKHLFEKLAEHGIHVK